MRKQTFQKTVVAALVGALTLGAAGTAFAADRHDDNRRGNDRHDNNDRRDDRRGDHDRWGNSVDMKRGYGADHRYYIGKNLPREQHQRYYVVDDWHDHHLRQPPRGYHWVQSGSDYLLVAVATGLIASAILGGN